ncbi:MAG: FtsH protease activity modulator HflK [Sphingomicrobium sp.]
MSILLGWGARVRGLLADSKGPWGSSGGSDGGETPPPEGDGPWAAPPKRPRRSVIGGGNVSSFEDFVKRGRARFGDGGPGGGLPGQPSRSVFAWAILALVLVWLLFTTFRVIAPEQRGVVTRFGRYSHTLSPGVGITLPWPIDRVQKVDVENIREITLGSGEEETLMLTGDKNIIDIAYQVRWKIRDPEQYLFALAQPDETIRQVAESAMRAVIANVTLQGAMGNERGMIESRVQDEMQHVLDAYQSGVVVQGIALRQADPPGAVNDAFKEVTAAQQEAQSYINNANAYALQLRQKAQGEATSFDKVYEQYRLAPEVTRRRMYYESMERVLQKVDKTIVEAPGVNSYLPLNELKRAAPKEPGQ